TDDDHSQMPGEEPREPLPVGEGTGSRSAEDGTGEECHPCASSWRKKGMGMEGRVSNRGGSTVALAGTHDVRNHAAAIGESTVWFWFRDEKNCFRCLRADRRSRL